MNTKEAESLEAGIRAGLSRVTAEQFPCRFRSGAPTPEGVSLKVMMELDGNQTLLEESSEDDAEEGWQWQGDFIMLLPSTCDRLREATDATVSLVESCPPS